MNQKWDGIERRKSLREKAEAMVASLSPEQMKTQPAEMLLHELLVHKIELEMQNDELQRTYNALAEARDRYWDFFEFAPVGYIVIDSEDQIEEINLTGAALLGLVRNQVLNIRFSKLVKAAHREDWYRRFRSMIDSTGAEKQSFDLEMIRSDGSAFHAHLDCQCRKHANTAPTLLVSVVEIRLS
ncbi:PAS domain-containing protein [Methylomonas sp. BW4-1]|uniref:PAS domain-containing protein n=1 Tax=Methylomonas sp. BW4-1 TaxID=3376685 RepID=UPI004042F59B